MDFCPSCQSIHMGVVPCGLTYGERLRSVRVDGAVLVTRSKRRYFDSAALDTTFGADRVDAYWDDTKGHGALEQAADGTFFHTDRSGERKRATENVLSDILNGPEAEDIV